jgi:hypothetical protein
MQHIVGDIWFEPIGFGPIKATNVATTGGVMITL